MRRISVLFLLIAFLLISTLALSATFYVSKSGNDENTGESWNDAFLTLVKGLETASSGDEVWGAEGVYREGNTVQIESGVSLYAGFTGNESVLSERDFRENRTVIDGEKKYRCVTNFGLLDGFHITGGSGEEKGAGILNEETGTVDHCVIYDNRIPEAGARGGGIFNSGNLSNSILYNNRAYLGGGIYNRNATVKNCLVYYNISTGPGGGVSAEGEGRVIHCTIINNYALSDGGGINLHSDTLVMNSIIWNNLPRDILGDLTNLEYSCFGGSQNENDNLSASPLFVMASGDAAFWDLHLKDASPCIDAGMYDETVATDMEGTQRPGTDGKVCMGAYESPDEFEPGDPPDPVRIYVSKKGSNRGGDSWENAYISIIDALYRLKEQNEYEIWVAEDVYDERMEIVIPPRVSIYGGFKGTEDSFAERDIAGNKTEITADSRHRCVTNYGTIDGFHITQGFKFTGNGGGILNSGEVRNCTLYNNLARVGGGIYNEIYGKIISCKVSNNQSVDAGGGVFNHDGNVEVSEIFNNESYNTGGGVLNEGGVISDCRIYANVSARNGGGVVTSIGYVNNCTINDNSSEEGAGGGIHNVAGEISECFLFGNQSGENGGGIYSSRGIVERCRFYENRSLSGNGGGLYNHQNTLNNCVFYENSTGGKGGGIFNIDNSKIYNCTLYKNTAGDYGGGIYNSEDYWKDEYQTEIINCISWNNYNGNIINELKSVSSSCFEESELENQNIMENPLFVNTEGDVSTWDLRLQDNSPCIDQGVAAESQADILGNPRPGDDGKYCMGAYESPDEYTSGAVRIVDRLYISKDGNNTNGDSWENAFNRFHEAVSFSDNHCEIWVKEGIYSEGQTVFIPGRIKVYGGFEGFEEDFSDRDYKEFQTVIDGENSYRCVINHGDMDGIIARNGQTEKRGGGIYNFSGEIINCLVYDNQSEHDGGGVYSLNGDIINCEVSGNDSSKMGGGIYIIGGVITQSVIFDNNGGGIKSFGPRNISECMIYNNVTKNDGGGVSSEGGDIIDCEIFNNKGRYGGGIFHSSGNNNTISGCKIYGNTGSTGGGIYKSGETSIINCQIQDNYAHNYGGGIRNGTGFISNCIISGNATENHGGGCLMSRSEMQNCLVYNNHAKLNGGGICTYAGSRIINCTIYNNSADSLDGGVFAIDATTIINSIIWRNLKGSVYTIDDISVSRSCFEEADGNNHNISANPLFENTRGDAAGWNFQLQNGSPCIDRGMVSEAPDTDMEGNPRPGGDDKVCIGAYESEDAFEPSEPAPPARLYVSKNGNNSDGLSWENAFLTLSGGLDNMPDDMTEIWVAEGVYQEPKTMIVPARTSLYGGFAGHEEDISQRKIDEYPAVIDGRNKFRVFENFGLIDGLTIINGAAERGAGVYNYSGEISKCTLSDNNADYVGGALYNRHGRVTECLISGNSSSSGSGGGILNNYGEILKCKIWDNRAEYNGGGIRNLQGEVIDCIIHDNIAEERYGGAIYNYRGDILNTVIYGNSALYKGSGIYNDSGHIKNCLVYANRDATGIFNISGRIYCCTVYGNNAADNDCTGIASNSGIVKNTISWNNDSIDIYNNDSLISYCCFGEADSELRNNIKADPLFKNLTGDLSTWDFHLQDGSPCIDSGTLYAGPNFDIEENPRPGGDGYVCIGAYESPDAFEPAPPSFPERVYVSQYGDDSDGKSWETAYSNIYKALKIIPKIPDNQPPEYDCEIWVAGGVYGSAAELVIPMHVKLYGGFAGNEENLSQRSFESNKTIIDARNKQHRCVTCHGVLDGFHVTNGIDRFAPGGGVLNEEGTVKNCIIYENYSKSGSGIYNYDGTVISCTIHSNTGDEAGIYNFGGDVIDCILYNNGDENSEYALYNSGGSVSGCRVYNNFCIGMYNYKGTIADSKIHDNDGIGIVNKSLVERCEIYNNSTGVENEVILKNCTVYNNRGSGVNNTGKILNCTIFKNGFTDGAYGVLNSSFTKIRNSIIWNNSTGDVVGSKLGINYSCFGEATQNNDNISSDPLFVKASGNFDEWDLRLQPDSPCIDAGMEEQLLLVDLEGVARPQGRGIDMGAYERRFPDYAEFIRQNIPENLEPGESVDIFIVMKNASSTVWSKEDGYQIKDCFFPESVWGVSEVTLDPGEAVNPDEHTTFTFTITAPEVSGDYDFQWQMFNATEEIWFGDKTPLVKIAVSEPLPGDLNKDGFLTIIDMNLLKEHLLNKSPLTPEEAARADASEDGILDVCDLISIMLNRD